ncbi:MAG: PAS domain-containing protein [Alphaproteobacteria bacterium]|nr:PAS domain-containing protein [Alphaproteobacteria bacterium]
MRPLKQNRQAGPSGEVQDMAQDMASPETMMPAVLHALPDAVFVTDAAGAVLFANHNAQAFAGLGGARLMGRDIRAVLGVDNAATNTLKTPQDGKSVTLRDLTLQGRAVESLCVVPMEEQGLFLWSLRCAPVPVKSAWMANARRALKPAQHLARMLAHEIKNPLSGIRGAAQLLMRAPLSEDDKELAALIDSETQRIFRLIDKVNIFDDAPQGSFAPVNLHSVLGHVMRLASSGFAAHANISTQYDPSLPDIWGNEDRLVQALLNMVKNAAEAVGPAGGKITLRSYYDTAPGFHPESHARLPICINIEDNGAGLSAEAQRHLFDPYYTTKAAGEGLGLSIVSKIIDDHGGAIDVSSVPGRTVFKLSFPMQKDMPT